jgi:ribosome-binding protein aMBF1 (putative translation factor)
MVTVKKDRVVKQLREMKGWSKADLARETKIQQGVIGWIESGRFIPYDSQLEKIARALNWEGNMQDLIAEEVEL